MLPLHGVGVVVTRPEQQIMPLCRLLEAQGARTLRLPVIEIRAFGERRSLSERMRAAEPFDLIVFVSANAVRFGAALLEQRRDLPLAAIGPATARSLNQAGYRVSIQPEDFSSEGLLNSPRLQHPGHRILLVQGRDGRALLQQELQARGAEVHCLEVYERVPAKVNPAALQQLNTGLAAGEWQAVTATSLDIGQRLLELAGPHVHAALEQVLWLVPSARVAKGLRERGLRAQLLQARSAQDQDLVSALLDWRGGESKA